MVCEKEVVGDRGQNGRLREWTIAVVHEQRWW